MLQVNHSPSFHTDHKLDKEIKEALLHDTLNLVNFGAVDRRKCIEEERRKIKERLFQRQNKRESKSVTLIWLCLYCLFNTCIDASNYDSDEWDNYWYNICTKYTYEKLRLLLEWTLESSKFNICRTNLYDLHFGYWSNFHRTICEIEADNKNTKNV